MAAGEPRDPFEARYLAAVDRALADDGMSRRRAMASAVGGDWTMIGALERQVLIHFGLAKDDYLIDVGCGAGRLAQPLASYLAGRYLGTDLSAALVEYARALVPRPDWRFAVVSGTAIPEADARADVVCFFSVFTHLRYEQSYRYLQEAIRVLKPGGTIVFSYLDLSLPPHWPVFENVLTDVAGNNPMTIFLGKDVIAVWAAHLGLTIAAIIDAGDPFLTLPEPVVSDTGAVAEGVVWFGHSLAVLRKP